MAVKKVKNPRKKEDLDKMIKALLASGQYDRLTRKELVNKAKQKLKKSSRKS